MINTATSFLALLQNDNLNMKSLALDKIEIIVDEHWAEISDYIKDFETLYSNSTLKEKNDQIALILSKLYFHLEAYEQAIEWALEAKSKFNYLEKTPYSTTILNKIIDKYVSIRKHNFYVGYFNKNKNEEENEDEEEPREKQVEKEIDERIIKLMVDIFHDCLESKEYKQAIGMCIDSYDLGRVSGSYIKIYIF